MSKINACLLVSTFTTYLFNFFFFIGGLAQNSREKTILSNLNSISRRYMQVKINQE